MTALHRSHLAPTVPYDKFNAISRVEPYWFCRFVTKFRNLTDNDLAVVPAGLFDGLASLQYL